MKTVLITGASSGIGKATAYKFAESKHRLILVARRIEKLIEIKEDIVKKYNTEVFTLELDVTNKKEIDNIYSNLPKEFQDIDILVNNAGLAKGMSKFYEDEIENWDIMIDVNIKGLLYMTRQILPKMVNKNEGHIINIGSTAGIYAYAQASVYCATKAAVKTLSDGIRIDTIDTDIKVTTVQPGIVETEEFSKVRFDGDEEKAKKIYEGIEALKAEDIAETIYFVSNQPKRVQISDITIMANQQATGFMIHKK